MLEIADMTKWTCLSMSFTIVFMPT